MAESNQSDNDIAYPRKHRPRMRWTRGRWKGLGVVLTAMAFFFMSALPAWAAETMRVTFVRHGQSAGNTSGNIDTSTPGPSLTPLGREQAQAVVDKLGDNNYDAIYASQMIRTQQTAGPMSAYLGLPIQVLPGLQEIEAGDYEGTPESGALGGYLKAPIAWAFQGALDERIPGSIDGHEFDARVDGALKTMYDKGDRNAIVFSHGGTMMFWTMMNATNLSTPEKIGLLTNHALGNTDYVVVEGNPEDGWVLTDWNGQRFTPEPSFEHEIGLQVRTLTRQLDAAARQVTDAFGTGDVTKIVTAINHSVAEASFSVTKFNRAFSAEVIKRVDKAFGHQSDPDSGSTEKVPDAPVVKSVASNTGSAADMLKPLAAAVADSGAAKAAADSETARSAESALGSRSIVDSRVDRAKSAGSLNRGAHLKDGNMARPGKAWSGTRRAGDEVREAVSGAAEKIASSVKSSIRKPGADKEKATAKAGAPSASGAGSADSDS